MEELKPQIEFEPDAKSEIKDHGGAATFASLFLLTKISFVSAPGIGNFAIACYVYFRVLPKFGADYNYLRKFRLLAALNIFFSLIAIGICFVIAYKEFHH